LTFEGREAVSDATPLVEAAIGALQPASATIARGKASVISARLFYITLDMAVQGRVNNGNSQK
jgi:hypothetical protein